MANEITVIEILRESLSGAREQRRVPAAAREEASCPAPLILSLRMHEQAREIIATHDREARFSSLSLISRSFSSPLFRLCRSAAAS